MSGAVTEKYSEVLVDWLVDLGYTHCFFVAGGNNMHLLDGVRKRLTCIPVVHEMAAGIAVEYFNEADGEGRAFALITAGPGLTHLVSAIAGAYLESRELLVLGGQVKSADLADGGIRQRGIQEVDGVAIATPVCKAAVRLEAPMDRADVVRLVEEGRTGRKGPVFLEICLDVQGAPVERAALEQRPVEPAPAPPRADAADVETVAGWLAEAERPILLIGGGVSRATAQELAGRLAVLGVPLMTTWNGSDRVGADHPLYFGRPNTWGQRYANVLFQQADLVVALGSRLSMQQTGFNWQEFAPLARIAQVDVDARELQKGHPKIDLGIAADADDVLRALVARDYPSRDGWVAFCRSVRARLPLDERDSNETGEGYLSPYTFDVDLAAVCRDDDILIPGSSGGAFTVFYQAFEQKAGQIVISDKALAAMGYGLGGAIGAALAHPRRRVVHTEGDGGFSQNMQELATVAVNGLNVKTFLLSNEGYASIRMTQRNYFGGQYLGCDTRTGLGFPDWEQLFGAYGIPVMTIDPGFATDDAFLERFDAPGPAAFIVPIDPEQTYFPKISSRVTAEGSMESNPLHLLSPLLPRETSEDVLPFLAETTTDVPEA